MNRRQLFARFASSTSHPEGMLGSRYFTNAVLRTHEGKEVRFYDDLIKGKHVVINFMYANCESACPAITANLVKVQEALKDRIGKDIFMYSITLKPEEDDPAALKHFAQMHRVKPESGWLFLTGAPYDITTIRFKVARWNHPGFDLKVTQHTGMVRVINEPINRWTGCSALASVETIKQVILWAQPAKPLEVKLRENAIAQAKIDSMETLPTWLGALGTD